MATFLHRTTKVIESDNGTGDLGANYIRNPDLSAVVGQPVKYWIIEGDAVRPAVGAEIAAADAQAATDAAAAATALLTSQRAYAVTALANLREESHLIDRATLLLLLREINLLRATFNTLKLGLTTVSTFQGLNILGGNLNSNTQRTAQQLRAAVTNSINDGSADS